jgi:hypothetical protein
MLPDVPRARRADPCHGRGRKTACSRRSFRPVRPATGLTDTDPSGWRRKLPFYRASKIPPKREHGRGVPGGYRRGRKIGGFLPRLRDMAVWFSVFRGNRCEKAVFLRLAGRFSRRYESKPSMGSDLLRGSASIGQTPAGERHYGGALICVWKRK